MTRLSHLRSSHEEDATYGGGGVTRSIWWRSGGVVKHYLRVALWCFERHPTLQSRSGAHSRVLCSNMPVWKISPRMLKHAHGFPKITAS